MQQPKPVRLEQNFEGIYPVLKKPLKWNEAKDELAFDFEGTGFVIRGETARWNSKSGSVYNTELYIDGKRVESPQLPASFNGRRHELAWSYHLPKGTHSVQLKIQNKNK